MYIFHLYIVLRWMWFLKHFKNKALNLRSMFSIVLWPISMNYFDRPETKLSSEKISTGFWSRTDLEISIYRVDLDWSRLLRPTGLCYPHPNSSSSKFTTYLLFSWQTHFETESCKLVGFSFAVANWRIGIFQRIIPKWWQKPKDLSRLRNIFFLITFETCFLVRNYWVS